MYTKFKDLLKSAKSAREKGWEGNAKPREVGESFRRNITML